MGEPGVGTRMVNAVAVPVRPRRVTAAAKTVDPDAGSISLTAQPPRSTTKLPSARASLPAPARATTETT